MAGIKLPIDCAMTRNGLEFTWQQVVDTPVGKHVVDHKAALPATVERAVERLITVVKQLLCDNAALQGQVEAMKAAREPQPATVGPKKGK